MRPQRAAVLVVAYVALSLAYLGYKVEFFRGRRYPECCSAIRGSARASNYSVLLVSVALGPKYDARRLRRNRKRYCEREKCSYEILTESIDGETQGSWMKLNAYKKFAPHYDYIWFLDADAFIMSSRCSIRCVIDRYSRGGITFSISHQQNDMITAGSFVAKSSPWTDDVVRRALTYRNDTSLHLIATTWEQAALIHLYREAAALNTSRFSFAPQPLMESYMWSWTPVGYERGHFVLHACGYPGKGYWVLVWYMWMFGYVEV